MVALHYTFLGQVSFLFEYEDLRWIIDPYLTNYVEDLYGEKFARNYTFDQSKVLLEKMDYCLITHAHEDHCDPYSINLLIESNPDIEIICDVKSAEIVLEKCPGVKVSIPQVNSQLEFSKDVKITTVPSAHTELAITDGLSEFNGYLMHVGDINIYHPGDTIPHRTIEKYLPNDIHVGFMPVNERNFFRDEMGIIGNMSVREAFQWSSELGIKTMIPTHWDMFALNNTDPEEIRIIAEQYENIQVQIPERFKKKRLL